MGHTEQQHLSSLVGNMAAIVARLDALILLGELRAGIIKNYQYQERAAWVRATGQAVSFMDLPPEYRDYCNRVWAEGAAALDYWTWRNETEGRRATPRPAPSTSEGDQYIGKTLTEIDEAARIEARAASTKLAEEYNARLRAAGAEIPVYLRSIPGFHPPVCPDCQDDRWHVYIGPAPYALLVCTKCGYKMQPGERVFDTTVDPGPPTILEVCKSHCLYPPLNSSGLCVLRCGAQPGPGAVQPGINAPGQAESRVRAVSPSKRIPPCPKCGIEHWQEETEPTGFRAARIFCGECGYGLGDDPVAENTQREIIATLGEDAAADYMASLRVGEERIAGMVQAGVQLSEDVKSFIGGEGNALLEQLKRAGREYGPRVTIPVKVPGASLVTAEDEEARRLGWVIPPEEAIGDMPPPGAPRPAPYAAPSDAKAGPHPTPCPVCDTPMWVIPHRSMTGLPEGTLRCERCGHVKVPKTAP